MVSPLMNMARSGDRRNRRSPVGMTVVSPSESVSPLDSKMTPTRKMLFQRRRLSSHSRGSGASPMEPVRIEDDMRDEVEHNARSSAHRRDSRNKSLHDRFSHIQRGLGTIDEERNQLLEQSKKLEKEKKLIQKQLELREREILTLVKRCASQEEKMRESSKLRSDNRELQHSLNTARRRLEEIDGDNEDMYSLKKKLQQSELDREHLQDRLAKLQREHDSIADTLQECLTNIRQLTEEKHQIEEERRREKRRAELELEKQHLAHVADSNNLKEDIQMHQSRILQMEKILQDNMYTNTALRREKAILTQGQHEEVQEVVQRYERQLEELRMQIDQTAKEKEDTYSRELTRLKEEIEGAVEAKEHEHSRTIATLREEMSDDQQHEFEKELQVMRERLEARDSLIEGLETEFSEQMEELMSKQSSLDEVEEERKILEDKVESMRNLETEHAALLDFVQILDSNLAELTSENAHLILEKDTLQEEVEGLRKTAEILQHQIESYNSNRRAREADFRDLLHAEKEELRAELEDALAQARKKANSLQKELDCRNEWISKLEGELKDSRRQIIQKENEISDIKTEMVSLRSDLNVALQQARTEVLAAESEIFAQDQSLASIEGRLDTAKAVLGNATVALEHTSRDNQILHLIDVEKLDGPDQERASGHDLSHERHLDSQLQTVRDEAMRLQNEIAALSSEKSLLAEEVEASRSHINERDDQIVKLQHSLLQHKKREKELEQRLGATAKELERQKQAESIIDSISTSTPSKSSLLSLEEPSSPTVEKSHEELDYSRRLIRGLEDRVKELEEELFETRKLREEKADKSLAVQAKADDLEQRVAGDELDSSAEVLQSRLIEAQKELCAHEECAESIAAEHQASLELREEQKENSKETLSEIAVLESKIQELNVKNAELEKTATETEERLSYQNESISLLQQEIVESEEGRTNLQSQIDNKNVEVKSLQTQLGAREIELDGAKDKLTETSGRISEKELQIQRLQSGLTTSNELVETLQQRLSETNEQHSSNDKAEDQEQKVKEYEEKIQTLLASQTELATELEKASNALEEQKMVSASMDGDLDDQVGHLKTQLFAVQGDLTNREICIKKLELSLQKNDEMYNGLEGTLGEAQKTMEFLKDQKRELNEKCVALELELTETRNTLNDQIKNLEAKYGETLVSLKNSEDLVASMREKENDRKEQGTILECQLSDARMEIQNLEQEVKIRGDRIESLENEIKELGSTDIELAFVESEKRRSHLEAELTKARNMHADLSKDLESREKRLLEVDAEMEVARKEIAHKEDVIQSREKKCTNLQQKIQSLDEVLGSREQQLMKLDNEIESMKTATTQESGKLEDLQTSHISLEEALDRANKELEHQKSLVTTLENAVDKHKADMDDVCHQNVTHEQRITSLEQALQSEIDLRITLESNSVTALEKSTEMEHENEELKRKLEEKVQTLSIATEELSETKKTLVKYQPSSPDKPSELENRVTELTTQLALRDDEIRELRLVELKDAEETVSSLTEEVNNLTEDALKKTSEIQKLKSDLEAATAVMEDLRASKNKIEAQRNDLESSMNVRDRTISSLKEALSVAEQREMEVRDERNLLISVEEEAQEEVENMKREMEQAIHREKEMADIKVRNKETLHKEEMDEALATLQSTMEKLRESESLLKERSSLLGEMVDQNKDLELKLEKEQTDLRSMEGKFAQSRVDFETTKKELKQSQHELRRKEAVLQSKMKEEQESKEFAEESLKKLKIKYNEAVKTQKCVTDLERQNSELRDKIRRQEAYLQRKLDKEKVERARLTPTKGIIGVSPAKSISSRTPTRRTGNSSNSRVAPPNAFTVPPRASKLQAPSSARSQKRNTYTPSRTSGIPTSSDRSVTSELSSLLRTPTQSKEQRDDSPVVPSWEDLE